MDDLSQLPFLYLTTTSWKSGRAHQIEIWFTAWNGCYYIIAEHGEKAHWVQNIRRRPGVTFKVGEQVSTGTGRVVEAEQEAELQQRISALSEAKYEWGDGLIVELKPEEGGERRGGE